MRTKEAVQMSNLLFYRYLVPNLQWIYNIKKQKS